MSDRPLDPKRLRDGNAARNPCSGRGCVPVWRPADRMHHYFHADDCEVMARIHRDIDEG